jgi:hypothetical protein
MLDVYERYSMDPVVPAMAIAKSRSLKVSRTRIATVG